MDRKMVKAGDFLIGGPPVNPVLTKVLIANSEPTLEETDERFDEAARLQEILARTKKAIDALKSKPN